MPRASSRSSASASRAPRPALASAARAAAGSPVEPRLDQPQAQGERHEPLLRPVVQVALQAPALGVAGLDDARPRGGELLVGVGVGQRLGDELGDARSRRSAPSGRWRARGPRRRARPTARPPTRTGRGDGRAEATCAGARPARRRRPRSSRPAAASPVRSTRTITVSLSSGTHAPTGTPAVAAVGPAADDRRRRVLLVAHDARARHAEQAPDLVGHLLEQRAGRPRRPRAWRCAAAPSARRRARRVARSLAIRRCSAWRRSRDVAERRTYDLGWLLVPRTGAELIATPVDARCRGRTHATKRLRRRTRACP